MQYHTIEHTGRRSHHNDHTKDLEQTQTPSRTTPLEEVGRPTNQKCDLWLRHALRRHWWHTFGVQPKLVCGIHVYIYKNCICIYKYMYKYKYKYKYMYM